MTVVLLIAAAWAIGLAIVVGLCFAARLGDEAGPGQLTATPAPNAPVSIAARRSASRAFTGSVGARDLVA
ncbi:MAG TPA: hypothetical protein VN618_09825 [Solirubrobacteraceae bacterium]|nr:hypothetical protein [Solirubrobacteraceae bacterium]